MTTTRSFLNQIFYIPKKFDIDFAELKPFMMTHEFMQNYKIANVSDTSCDRSCELFQPMQQDSLFWCIYTIHHGISEYMMIQNKHKNKEMDEKQHILQYIQQHGMHIKDMAKQSSHKITQVGLKEIQSELLLDTKVSFAVFAVLCIYYKINAVIKTGSTYMHFNTGQECTYLFNQNKNVMFDVDLTPMTMDDISHIQSTCILIPYDQEKPLKTISNYKVSDLEDLAAKLQISFDKMKKADLYNALLQRLMEIQNW